MGYSAVTLGDEDVEWYDPSDAEVKSVIWSDDAFRAFTERAGIEGALEAVTKFHRSVSNQLIGRGVSRFEESDWSARTITLTKRVKARRNELRRYFANQYGWPELIAFKRELDAKYPRVEWGSLA